MIFREGTVHTVCRLNERHVVEWSWPWALLATCVMRLCLSCGHERRLSLRGTTDLLDMNCRHETMKQIPNISHSLGYFCWSLHEFFVCVRCCDTDNNLFFPPCNWSKWFTFMCCGVKLWSGSENELIGAQWLSERSLGGSARELSDRIKLEKALKKRDWLILKLEALQFLEIIVISR